MTTHELLQLAGRLNAAGEPYAMVTVVRVAAPTSAYVGAQAIVREDGSLAGWIGGGCARDVVIAAALEAIAADEPKLVRITNAADGATSDPQIEQHPMACASNGTIELFIQPYSTRLSLCIVGDTPAAEDARHFAGRLGIRLVATPGEAAVVLIATQGTADADALELALASPAAHVLMIASRRKADRLREVMRLRGVDPARLSKLQAPAGPDAGARTPAEIALTAMTGVLAALRGKTGSAFAAAESAPPQRPSEEEAIRPADRGAVTPVETPRARTFVNPVCGMAVPIDAPMHVETFEGEAYYFCCDGCRETFIANPAKYAAIHHAASERTTT
jgi:xanthine dehydrogenase accessory factor